MQNVLLRASVSTCFVIINPRLTHVTINPRYKFVILIVMTRLLPNVKYAMLVQYFYDKACTTLAQVNYFFSVLTICLCFSYIASYISNDDDLALKTMLHYGCSKTLQTLQSACCVDGHCSCSHIFMLLSNNYSVVRFKPISCTWKSYWLIFQEVEHMQKKHSRLRSWSYYKRTHESKFWDQFVVFEAILIMLKIDKICSWFRISIFLLPFFAIYYNFLLYGFNFLQKKSFGKGTLVR